MWNEEFVALDSPDSLSDEVLYVAYNAIERARLTAQAVAMESRNKVREAPARYTTERDNLPGANILKFRAERGLTQRALAERCKTTTDHTFIARLESGKSGYSRPSLETLAEALGVTVSDFFLPAEIRKMALLTPERKAKIIEMIEDAYTLDQLKKAR